MAALVLDREPVVLEPEVGGEPDTVATISIAALTSGTGSPAKTTYASSSASGIERQRPSRNGSTYDVSGTPRRHLSSRRISLEEADVELPPV